MAAGAFPLDLPPWAPFIGGIMAAPADSKKKSSRHARPLKKPSALVGTQRTAARTRKTRVRQNLAVIDGEKPRKKMRSARVKARNRLPNLEASPAALATAKAPLQAKMASLAAAVDELSGLLADTGIAVILWDSFFCLRRFSPSINGPFTLTAADIGRTWGELVTKIPDEHLGEDLQKVWNTREAQEARVHCDDGRIYSRRARLYRRSDGEISGVVVLFAEITARAERTLVDSAHSESETMTDAAKQLFLVNLSHELRTPLSAMLLWTKLLLESSSSDPANLKEGLLALRKCAEEQHALIEGLVGTSRTPFGQTDAG